MRGKHIGVKFVETGRKHRLKTLGLQEEFSACNRRIDDASQQAEINPSPTRETTPQQIEENPMSNKTEFPWEHKNINTEEEAETNKETMADRAVEEVVNEVNHDLQIAADFLRGPTLTDKEKLEAKKLEFYKREQLKQLRKKNQKTKQTSLKRWLPDLIRRIRCEVLRLVQGFTQLKRTLKSKHQSKWNQQTK